MQPERFIPYAFERLPPSIMLDRSRQFLQTMQTRRSIRHFSAEPVPRECIENAILTASSAPSGAHRQPWKFIAVSDAAIKRKIREAAESEERLAYEQRMSSEWIDALRPLGTNWEKPFLETVPWIVVVFEQLYEIDADNAIRKNYYVKESVGIACGLLIAALHQMGLVTLTHTPSPMGFLGELLQRPKNERALMLFPIGYPTADAVVPDLRRKSLEQVSEFLC